MENRARAEGAAERREEPVGVWTTIESVTNGEIRSVRRQEKVKAAYARRPHTLSVAVRDQLMGLWCRMSRGREEEGARSQPEEDPYQRSRGPNAWVMFLLSANTNCN